MNSTNTSSCLYRIPSGWRAGLRMNLPLLCFLISFSQLAQWPGFSPFLWPSWPPVSQVLFDKGCWCCKSLTPTHYFHPPHKDQSIRLQTIIHKKTISVATQHFKDCYCYTLSVGATLLLFVYQVSINLKVTVENRYFGLWISVF